MSRPDRGSLAFIGVVHLDAGDPALHEFLAFLGRLGRSAERIVLLGDLFNLWIGRRELEQPHQAAVVDKLAELRRGGTVVRYVEGNRDYRIGDGYVPSAFDDVTSDSLAERFGGHHAFVAHGDRVNAADRRYRAWRRFSRSAAVWAAFNALPRRARARLAARLEQALRRTNAEFKREFPEAQVRRYAAAQFATGHDLVVLGHFHVEREIHARGDGRGGEILVLPEWRASRRHLELTPDGAVRFTNS